MKKKVQPIPAGYGAVTPYLSIRGAAKAIKFYRKVFGAREILRMRGPGGKVGHAEILIGGSHVMIADEFKALNFLSPKARGGSTVHIQLYVRNCDAVIARAVRAGAKLLRPIADQFYGDRSGSIKDPFGHVWHVATHKEDVSRAEMKKRMKVAVKARS